MDESLEISLESFIILVILTALFTYYVWKKGFYTFPDREESKHATFLQTVMAFLLFFSPPLFLLGLFRNLASTVSLILSVLLTAFILSLFAKLTIFKDRPQFSLQAFGKGLLTWLIAYPQMLIISIIINFVLVSYFDVTPIEQTTVRELRALKTQNPSLFFLFLLTVSFVVPICEELLFRGYLQSFFKKKFSVPFAIIVSSLIFALFHYTGSQGAGNFVIIPSLFFLSLYLGFVYEKFGTIAAPIGLHTTFNFISTMMILYQ